MTAEEYVKHYASGQGGYESVPVDIALRAIEYAKRETKQQIMKDAVDGEIVSVNTRLGQIFIAKSEILNDDEFKWGDKVKLIIVQED